MHSLIFLFVFLSLCLPPQLLLLFVCVPFLCFFLVLSDMLPSSRKRRSAITFCSSFRFLSFCVLFCPVLDLTLAHYLITLDSDAEIREYVSFILGTGEAAQRFAEGFLQHRDFDRHKETVITSSSSASLSSGGKGSKQKSKKAAPPGLLSFVGKNSQDADS